ncbi:hypothetical protein PR202_gb07675 [Eleusine coracana subsp. coracana]|uniref:Uncharacterized protein n=1 Tax=Eleusine coracana subsp. coracana TaxID=191504 RepID=A0AAV5EBZ5_ELECO|nr:hypothetical protein PR202_gb07675 [Eleusine coracana subsp. coracana]
MQQGLNSAVILEAWALWRHRNDCIFNKAALSIETALTLAGEESNMWCVAGAKALSSVTGFRGRSDEV